MAHRGLALLRHGILGHTSGFVSICPSSAFCCAPTLGALRISSEFIKKGQSSCARQHVRYLSSLPVKMRLARKKQSVEHQTPESSPMAVAYSTAEEYNLASVVKALERQGLYEQKVLSEDLSDVLCAAAKYEVDEESRDLFIFREGSVVFWNFPEIEVMVSFCVVIVAFLLPALPLFLPQLSIWVVPSQAC